MVNELMTIGFTGTRQIEKISALRLDLLYKKIIFYKIDYDLELTLLHGCAFGADSYFHSIGINENIPIIGRPTYNRNFDLRDFEYLHLPEAPLTRNKKIVDDCDILIALPIDKDVEELRSGTWATIRYARKQNKQIIMI